MDIEKILEELPEPLEAALYAIVQRIDAEHPRGEATYAHACAILGAYFEQNSLQRPTAIRLDPASPMGTAAFLNASVPDRSIERAETKWERTYLAYKEDVFSRWSKWKAHEASAVLARQKEESFGYAVLTPDEKAVIHSHLAEIRAAIERSSLSDRKKNRLYVRIAALASETDRNGTHTDRFFAFMGDLAFTSGEMTEDAKPALNEFREVLKIIMRSREKAEGAKLPSLEDLPQLPPSGSV